MYIFLQRGAQLCKSGEKAVKNQQKPSVGHAAPALCLWCWEATGLVVRILLHCVFRMTGLPEQMEGQEPSLEVE